MPSDRDSRAILGRGGKVSGKGERRAREGVRGRGKGKAQAKAEGQERANKRASLRGWPM